MLTLAPLLAGAIVSSTTTTSARCGQSQHEGRRTFDRQFRAQTGTSPHQWLLHHRVMSAQRLLESTDLPVEAVARECGFGTAVSLRPHFRRIVGVSPQTYRTTFRIRSA